MTLILRGKTWTLKRRVPARFRHVDPRGFVYLSLGTDSEAQALVLAEIAWQGLLDGWQAQADGHDPSAGGRFEAARALAKSRGFRYLSSSRVAELPLGQLLDRVLALQHRSGIADPLKVEALLGGASKPRIRTDEVLELFWPMTLDRRLGMSPDQVRRWENPRKKAVANWNEVVGIGYLDEINAEDGLDFHQWWSDRIEAEGLTPGSANKDLTHLTDVFGTVARKKGLANLMLPFKNLRFRDGELVQRPPLDARWVQDVMLKPGNLDGLNPEARDITLALVNTGARPCEIEALRGPRIHLDCNIPHIEIAPDERRIKTKASRRRIPLAGVSLEAMRRWPDGFPTYRVSPSLSATVNRYFRGRDLYPTPRHSLYGLRHGFKDRLRRVEVDYELRNRIMGHGTRDPDYGDGHALEQAAAAINAVAI